MSNLTIKSNNQYRDTIRWSELSVKEQKEFNYLDTEEEQESAIFIRYLGTVYCTDGFIKIGNNSSLKGWDGYLSDSAFSGILVKLNKDGDYDTVCMGRYYS